MADIKVVERPKFDFVQTLEQARALAQLAETLQSVIDRNRAARDHALDLWSGPWGDEFRRRADEDEDNVSTVAARLRNDADQWGTIWQQAAIQTNRCAYAEAVFAKRDEINGELSHLDEAARRAADRWSSDGKEPLDFVFAHGDVVLTGADLLVAGVRDLGEAIGSWIGGNDAMGEALEYVREPSSFMVARPKVWNNFRVDSEDFAHYQIGDLIHYRSTPGAEQPPTSLDEVHRIPDTDGEAEPPEHDDAADRPDPVAIEANRASLGAENGCCCIDLDALDRYLDGFTTVDGRVGDPELFAQYESTRTSQGPAIESAGLHGRYLDQVALPAVDIYLSFLNFNLLGMMAVRAAVGPNASGVVTVSNGFIAAVLKQHGLDKPPGLIKITDSEFEGLPPNSGFADDPVCMATGNFVHTELDLAMPGFSDAIAARRVYNAASSSLGIFGFGWSSTLDMYVHAGAASVEVRLADGARLSFSPREDGSFAPQRGRRLTLERLTDGWVVTQGYDSSWFFDDNGALVGGQEGVAAWSVERTPTTVTCTDAQSGRTVRYELDEETQLVQRAATSDGRTASWSYDDRLACIGVDRASGGHAYEVDDDLRIVAITDADGVEFVRNTYDRWGRVASQLNPFGRESVYEYDDDGTARIREADTGALATQMSHDAKANLLSIVGADSGVMRMEWNDESRLAGVIDRKGQETRYEYVADAREDLITRTVRADGLEEIREWDDTGRLVRFVDASGGAHTFDYDGTGRVASRITDPTGATTIFELDDRELATRITDADGVIVTQEWDADGQLLSLGTLDGPTARFAYDDAGHVATVVGPNGERTDFTNDAGGHVIGSEAANGTSVYTYTPAGRVTSSTRNGTNEWRIEYGDHGEPIRRFDAAGEVTDFEYDGFGRCVAVVVGEHRFENHFDALGQLLGLSVDGVRISTTEFDGNGNWIRTVDADGISIDRQVDAMDQTTSISRNGNEVVARTNHPNGCPAVVRRDGVEHRIEIDAAGRPIRVAGERGVLSFEYTPGGRLASRTTPAGRMTTYTYGSSGHVATITDADGVVSHITSDSADLHLERANEEIGLQFDELGRLTAWTEAGGTGTTTWLDGAADVQFGSQNPARIEVNHTGLATQITDPAGAAATLRRDRLGRIVEMATVDERVILDHDICGAPSSIVHSGGETTTLEHTAGGRVRRIEVEGGENVSIVHDRSTGEIAALLGEDERPLLAFGRDQHLRLSSFATPDSTVEVDRDAGGLTERIRSSVNGTTTWTYDADGLVMAIESSAGHQIEIDRSAAGNIEAFRTGALELPVVAVTRAGERNDARQITVDRDGRVHRYDDAGRLVESVTESGERFEFTYNAASMIESERTPLGERHFFYEGVRLVRIDGTDGTHRFEYDQLGRRTIEYRPNGEQVRYTWSPLDQLVATHTVHADGTERRRELLHSGLGRVERIDTTAVHWDDMLSGKPIGIGDRTFLRSGTHICEVGEDSTWHAGVGDDPYGYGTSGSGIDLGFHGELTLDGLVLMGARVYDPNTRSFLTRDPLQPVLAFTGGANPYNFANSDPVNRFDPSGLRPISMDDFDAWRTSMTTSRAEAFWNAIVEDPDGFLLLGATVLVGGLLVASGFGAVGGAVLIGVAISAGFGFANKNFNPTRTAIDGIVSGVAAGAGGAAGAFITKNPLFSGFVTGLTAGAVGGAGGSLAGQKINPDGSWNPDEIDGEQLLLDTGRGALVGAVSGPLSAKAGVKLESNPLANDGAEFVIGTGVSMAEDVVLDGEGGLFTGEVNWKDSVTDGVINAGAGAAARGFESTQPVRGDDGPPLGGDDMSTPADTPTADIPPDTPRPDVPPPEASRPDTPPPADVAPVDALQPDVGQPAEVPAQRVETTPPPPDTPPPDLPPPDTAGPDAPRSDADQRQRHDGDTRNGIPEAETPRRRRQDGADAPSDDGVGFRPGDPVPAPDGPLATAETTTPGGTETIPVPGDAPAGNGVDLSDAISLDPPGSDGARSDGGSGIDDNTSAADWTGSEGSRGVDPSDGISLGPPGSDGTDSRRTQGSDASDGASTGTEVSDVLSRRPFDPNKEIPMPPDGPTIDVDATSIDTQGPTDTDNVRATLEGTRHARKGGRTEFTDEGIDKEGEDENDEQDDEEPTTAPTSANRGGIQ